MLLGSETILLVEDDSAVRTIAERSLESYGYTGFSAGSPDEADEIFDRHADEIALLLSDVVMPGRSGPDLYERLLAKHPSIKVLFTSGYTATAILRTRILDSGKAFIQKPFSPNALVRKVREVLDG